MPGATPFLCIPNFSEHLVQDRTSALPMNTADVFTFIAPQISQSPMELNNTSQQLPMKALVNLAGELMNIQLFHLTWAVRSESHQLTILQLMMS